MDVLLHRLLNNLSRDKAGVDPRIQDTGVFDRVAAEDDPDVLRLENIDTDFRPHRRPSMKTMPTITFRLSVRMTCGKLPTGMWLA